MLASLLFLSLTLSSPAAQPDSTGPRIRWLTVEQADSLRHSEPRKILIDIYTDWCGWCKRLDANTFADPSVVAMVNSRFYAVKLDGEEKRSITLGDTEYAFVENGRKGYHQLASELMQGKMSYPTLVFLDEQFNMIQPLPGYRDAEELLPILEYLATDAHLTQPWEEWLSARQGAK